MKDKRTYKYEKEHGEDMTHENEVSFDVSAITDQYRADLKKYQDREALYIQTANKLKGAQQIAVEMATTVAKLDRKNQELMKEIDRLNEEIQLLELKIKK